MRVAFDGDFECGEPRDDLEQIHRGHRDRWQQFHRSLRRIDATLHVPPWRGIRSVLDRKTFSVPVSCPVCGRLVRISYASPADPPDTRFFQWRCPYPGCRGRGAFRLHGELLGVAAGLPTYFVPHAVVAPRARGTAASVEIARAQLKAGQIAVEIAAGLEGDADVREKFRDAAIAAHAAVARAFFAAQLDSAGQTEILVGLDRLALAIGALRTWG